MLVVISGLVVGFLNTMLNALENGDLYTMLDDDVDEWM